jgi:hypothetical protein
VLSAKRLKPNVLKHMGEGLSGIPEGLEYLKAGKVFTSSPFPPSPLSSLLVVNTKPNSVNRQAQKSLCTSFKKNKCIFI